MSKSLASLLGSDATAHADVQITGLTSDSRQVKPGYLFAAIAGGKQDGVSFIAQAFEKGAAAVLAASNVYGGAGVVAVADNPRRALARIAARFYGAQPETIVAVTGTNGKTSVAVFVRQIWAAMGFRAASLGTIGLVGPDGNAYSTHTTPDPVKLHELAAQLRTDHVKHLVIEASSHGLAQHRLDGLELTAGAFTNLTHDHLDYHGSMEDYFAAKMRLFSELLPQGASAVIDMDGPMSSRVEEICRKRELVVIGVGRAGKAITLLDVKQEGLEQHLLLRTHTGEHQITLPLAGNFQVSNALVAAGLVIAAGGDESQALHALQSLKGAPGRLDFVGYSSSGASVFVDYAHTPDALENALASLRPYAKRKLVVVFGCGGDRDKAKRPLMGAIAVKFADHAIVTDDNPRTEDAVSIRAAILAAAKGAEEIADRAEAIRLAITQLQAGDVLLVAGKGHEEGQMVGTHVLPFSDHAVVRAAIEGARRNV
jgi:UDP-N-acetylmuramoyl-L-alanyl-D-glutamate--2,6-diaminopimelate ligase